MRPIPNVLRDDPYLGVIEETVREARFVDPGIEELKKIEVQSPLFGRREFLLKGAAAVGTAILAGCGGAFGHEAYTDGLEKGAKIHPGWEAELMKNDPIRGPSLLISGGVPSDFEAHRERMVRLAPSKPEFGAVDYDTPVGIPVTPVFPGTYFKTMVGEITSSVILMLWHDDGSNIDSLSRWGPTHVSQYIHISKSLFRKKKRHALVNLDSVVAISGDSGFTRFGRQPPHLHLQIMGYRQTKRTVRGREIDWWVAVSPGIDPFKLGIDSSSPKLSKEEYLHGRPVYWDGETQISDAKRINHIYIRNQNMKGIMDTLESSLSSENLDQKTLKRLLKSRDSKDPTKLRDDIAREVLLRHTDPKDGRKRYKYLPGSFMYTLMLQTQLYTTKRRFTAMLPFPSPLLKSHYQSANPNIKL